MKKAVKTFALSAMSVALLSGCILDDKYSDGSSGGGGGPVENIGTTLNIYGWDWANVKNHEDFELYRLDSNNQQTLIERNRVQGGDGTSVVTDEFDPDSEGWFDDDALHVTITEDGGSIVIKSSKNWDLSNTTTAARYGEGVIRATIFPLSTPVGDNRIYAQVPGSTLDITDFYNAISGSSDVETRINIPYSCFPDFNKDNLNSTNTPLTITSEGSLEFAIDEITIRSNSFARDQHSVDCNLDHEAAPTGIFVMTDDDRFNAEGWATTTQGISLPSATGGGYTGATHNVDGQNYHGLQVTFGANSLGGIHFNTPDLLPEEGEESTVVFKDLSTHVAHSAIRFNIIADTSSGATAKDLDFRVRASGEQLEHHFDTDDEDKTNDQNLDGTNANYETSVYVADTSEYGRFTINENQIGEVVEVTIPVADLFNNNGANLPRRINRLTIQGDGGSGNAYQHMTYHISDIEFVDAE